MADLDHGGSSRLGPWLLESAMRFDLRNLTAGKDHRTYALSLAILQEETLHESWFSEFLGEGPSGHYLRRGETSPFVRPYLR